MLFLSFWEKERREIEHQGIEDNEHRRKQGETKKKGKKETWRWKRGWKEYEEIRHEEGERGKLIKIEKKGVRAKRQGKSEWRTDRGREISQKKKKDNKLNTEGENENL